MPLSPSVTVDVVDRERRQRVVVGDRAEALPSAIVAFDRVGEVDVNVSLASSSRSPLTSTVTVFVVCPGAKLSVPAAGV